MSVLLIDATPIELRIGRLEDEVLTRLSHVYPDRDELRVGDLVRARADRFDQRLGGAFCTVGTVQAFLPVPKGKPPAQGRVFLASVRREAIGEKVAQLSDQPALRLPGVTILPGEDGLVFKPGPVALPEVEKARVRGAAEAMAANAFEDDVPGLVAAPPIALRALTRMLDAEVTEVRVADGDLAAQVRSVLTPLGIETVHAELAELRAALDEAEEAALARIVRLPGGGRLVVDETEALISIDVDLGAQQGRSKRGAASRLADEVFSALGRQGGLRSLGGQIVLDLPRGAIQSPKIVRDRLARALSHHGRPSVPAVTGEGVCVVIAPRSVPSLLERLTEPFGGGVRPGRRLRADVIAARAYRALEAALLADRTGTVVLACNERAAPYLSASTETLGTRYGPRFRVEPAPTETFHVR